MLNAQTELILQQALLLLISTAALRDAYLHWAKVTEFLAWCETEAEASTGLRWYFARLFSCPVCITYWLGVLAAVCIWILPVLGWVGQIPIWLLCGIASAWLVNLLHSKKEESSKPINPGPRTGPLTEMAISSFQERQTQQQTTAATQPSDFLPAQPDELAFGRRMECASQDAREPRSSVPDRIPVVNVTNGPHVIGTVKVRTPGLPPTTQNKTIGQWQEEHGIKSDKESAAVEQQVADDAEDHYRSVGRWGEIGSAIVPGPATEKKVDFEPTHTARFVFSDGGGIEERRTGLGCFLQKRHGFYYTSDGMGFDPRGCSINPSDDVCLDPDSIQEVTTLVIAEWKKTQPEIKSGETTKAQPGL